MACWPAVGAAPQALPPPPTHSAQLIDAINWAIAENDRTGGPYFHRLDTSKIALMGMSCGGAQAIEASAESGQAVNGKVIEVVKGGLILDLGVRGETTMGGGKALTKEDLKLIHAPVAYISGDESDVAFVNANDDFQRIDRVPAFRAYRRMTGHGGTYGEHLVEPAHARSR